MGQEGEDPWVVEQLLLRDKGAEENVREIGCLDDGVTRAFLFETYDNADVLRLSSILDDCLNTRVLW